MVAVDGLLDETVTLKGYPGLAVAVLALAVSDASAGDEAARDFLLSPEVELILAGLDLSAEYCRRLVDMVVQVGTEPSGEWLTVAQAAARYGCCPEAIRQSIREGRLQARGGGRGREWWVLAEGMAEWRHATQSSPQNRLVQAEEEA